LAFVALRAGRVERSYAAGALWPFGDETRAGGNLRSALWRIRQAGIDVLIADKWSLVLADRVLVDVNLVAEWANRLIHDNPLPSDLDLDRLPVGALDLLSGWYDDWAIIERERTRQRTLHALEAMTRHLVGSGRCADAIQVAMTVVAAEPLRESAQRVLLESHLAHGNWAEAEHSYESFRVLMRDQLGVAPSRQLEALMAQARLRVRAPAPRGRRATV
jgi:DNA-binding SARP family transcriptional activator